MILRLLVIIIGVCWVNGVLIPDPAYAKIQMSGFQGSAIQGKPVSVSPEWSPEPVEYIRVYYRAMGTKSYQRLDLVQKKGARSMNLALES